MKGDTQMAATETIDRAVVLARMLRTIDNVIAETKKIERDRDQLRRILETPQTSGGTS